MDLENLSVFNLAHQNMKYLTEREKVIAANVANANTPGYLPKDIEKPKFRDELKTSLAMTLTNPLHMSGIPQKNEGFKVYTPKPDTPLTIDGNGVVIEDQLNEASKSKSEYNRLITIYGKYRDMLKTANTKISI